MTIHHNFMQIASCLLNSFENQSITHDSIKKEQEKEKRDQHTAKIPSPFSTFLGSLLNKISTYHQNGTYYKCRYCEERDTVK